MIDVENQIYTKIATALRASFPGINVTGVPTYSPSAFPCVEIEEADNYSYLRTRDTESNENFVEVMYEVNVYSNLTFGEKSECKSILAAVDGIMNDLGFTRTARTNVTAAPPMTYRMVARYSAVIGQNETIYRR